MVDAGDWRRDLAGEQRHDNEEDGGNHLSMVTTLRIGIICLLASLSVSLAHAAGFSMGNSKPHGKDAYTTNRPWGNIEPSKPAPLYQPPQPLPGSYYPGAAPGTGWYSAQLPASSAAGNSAPVVEVDVEGSVFYEQQNIVYTVHVVSDGNLALLDAELPRIEGAAMELIDGPVASTRSSGYSRTPQIVNTYRYKLMPLHSGKVVIPAIRFTGTYAAGNQSNNPQGNKFTIAAAKPLTLQVRPADPAVQPWLPLYDLRLQTNLQQEGPAKAGQPVTLTLELTARGALGTQLPSLAHQLESPHYRVYRDSTTTRSGISSNGRYLTGSRKETYTLIPLEDGWIRLPEINVAWWDIDMQTARLAGLAAHAVQRRCDLRSDCNRYRTDIAVPGLFLDTHGDRAGPDRRLLAGRLAPHPTAGQSSRRLVIGNRPGRRATWPASSQHDLAVATPAPAAHGIRPADAEVGQDLDVHALPGDRGQPASLVHGIQEPRVRASRHFLACLAHQHYRETHCDQSPRRTGQAARTGAFAGRRPLW